jgi:hypothetical protein
MVFGANGKLFLKRIQIIKSYFNYNKSGIEVRHGGSQWVQRLSF